MSRRSESGVLPGTYAELKRGRKVCKNTACDVIIGAGRKKCPVCNQSFGARSKKDESTGSKRARTPVVSTQPTHPAQDVLLIPAGHCPVKLDSTQPADVRRWVRETVKHWEAEKGLSVVLSTRALEFWARQFYPYKTQEHTAVCKAIREAFSG